ncbi:MAG: pilus assembly protein [Armatimonadetes bacterium]|nr:pilus assembly protein [Armatimonadota bacterium]MCX7968353.1 pilus assembly protein [Armatimonadota bacterium]MDW8142832.1 TadE/TadG family type IV pilus assembly protein [Armatimonadota bacterium]
MRKGQTLIELALALVFLLVILAGLADYGRIHSARIALIHAAREGAFFVASNPDDLQGARERVKQEAMTAGILLSDSDITFQVPTGENRRGQPVTVTIQTRVPTIFARFLGFSSITVSVHATAPMMR